LKPDQLHCPRFVAQRTNQSLGSAFPQGFKAAENPPKLHRFAFLVYVPGAVEFGAIHIAKGEMKQQVTTSENTQLRLQGLGTLGSYAFQKLNVEIKVGQNIDWSFWEEIRWLQEPLFQRYKQSRNEIVFVCKFFSGKSK
jgi:hypothetical protein